MAMVGVSRLCYYNKEGGIKKENMKFWFVMMSCFLSCVAFSKSAWAVITYNRSFDFYHSLDPHHPFYIEFNNSTWILIKHNSESQRKAHWIALWIENEAIDEMDMSRRDRNKALLHGREDEGGNLLHHLARQKDLNPQIVEEVITTWARKVPVRKFSKVLKHKDTEGMTPKELARKLQNNMAFEALSSAEDIVNKRNTKHLALLGIVSAGSIAAGAIGAAKGVISTEQALAVIGPTVLLSIPCLKAFKKRKIPKISPSFSTSQHD